MEEGALCTNSKVFSDTALLPASEGPNQWGFGTMGIHHLGHFVRRRRRTRRLAPGSFSFLFSEHLRYFMSSSEGPLATVPENGSFKVREVRAKEQKEQLLQMRGCLDALGLEKGRHPTGKKATHQVLGLAHSLIKQEQYDGAGWDPQKPHGWMSSSASPPTTCGSASGWAPPLEGPSKRLAGERRRRCGN